MKTKVMCIAAFMVFVASVAAVGKDEPRAGFAVVPVKGSEVFKVIYKGESASKVKLNVLDASSDIVFTETFNKMEGFIRPLNFSGLKFGEYTVELTDATGTRTEKVSHQPRRLIAFTCIEAGEGGRFFCFPVQKRWPNDYGKIFDEANNLLYTGSRSDTGDFAQIFTLKDVYGGVTFEISDASGHLTTVRF
jgi:hypothetical protein